MRFSFSIRRRRPSPESFRRDIHTQPPRPKARNPQGKKGIQWFSIPLSVGVGVVGLVQLYKSYKKSSSSDRQDGSERATEPLQKKERDEIQDEDSTRRPRRRPRIRPDGPWQVRVMSTLPLKAISRLWGWFNQLTIPYYLRAPGFKLYSFIFGVNLDEVSEPDIRTYRNLAAFFYRTLKPGARPLDPRPEALLSPSDGRVLQFGQIEGNDIEQVKGMTYTIDALLGKNTPPPSINRTWPGPSDTESTGHNDISAEERLYKDHEEFARLNDIPYTLPNLLSGEGKGGRKGSLKDQSVSPDSAADVFDVGADLAMGEQPWYDMVSPEKKTALYYAVIYLAPGDYHRFHSPANWVVERRRHFAGELYSVSPYLQKTLPGLFTLNERVVLLGRWRWGFFSFVPVGATNVGSIIINFDRELRTNSLITDTAADRAAEEAAAKGEQYLGFSEATYADASPILHGHGVKRGDEMGGFQLGSTVVLVFEAPVEKTSENGERTGWVWEVEKGQTVKMGQALGSAKA
ncbi:related to phosphatidylserine decarboxylase [Cephalotrichum gorgonifer]|uniref:Phosphatidylserine decarboxylase proenzyme 1, mitochondrial n=1 Tax=Cephalotrichum gorgonifer TaxID=2041049 RepID=A0AAE8MRR0_9PEZI|nr:related to phosphatidylserine decarboxylase [Cephalotrichum gorgonifer]